MRKRGWLGICVLILIFAVFATDRSRAERSKVAETTAPAQLTNTETIVSGDLADNLAEDLRLGQGQPCVSGRTEECVIVIKPGMPPVDGTRKCTDGKWGKCLPIDTGNHPPPPAPVVGTVTPRYYVLTVVYAPPGTNGGKSSSSVNYSTGSTAGSTVSSSSAFKQSNTLSITASAGILGTKEDSAGVSFGLSNNQTDTQSVDIKKSQSTEINDTGPASDGINHDHDLIYLWLNPVVQVTLFPAAAGGVSKVQWKPLTTGTNVITYLYVGWLRDPSQIPPGELQLLQRYGITPADYAQIIKADPFWYHSPLQEARIPTAPDPKRFQELFTTFPYEPPFSQGDPVPTFKFNSTYTTTSTNTSSTQTETTVGLTVQSSGSFLSLFTLAIKDVASWTWTNTDTRSDSQGTTESVSVTVGGPAFGYKGSLADVAVYYDVIYKTFLFAPLGSSTPVLTGAVSARSGHVGAGQEVIVVANGITHRTFTNSKGEYKLYGNISGPLTLKAGGMTKNLPSIPAERKADLQMP